MDPDQQESLEHLTTRLSVVKNPDVHFQIDAVVQGYDFLDKGVSQVYVVGTPEEFALVKRYVALAAAIPDDRVISATMNPTNDGDIPEQILAKVDFDERGTLVAINGFEDYPIAAHGPNQSIYYTFQKLSGRGILLYHIDPSHPKYLDALMSAKGSQFKERMIEFEPLTRI
ncbi:TPA: hypothetical protein HA251_00265 [Candidatus Woesearchaeota archaeon]|nr:hypothetical protein [Candidatus Woesearchaeota archaeon]